MRSQTNWTDRREWHYGKTGTRRACERLIGCLGFLVISISPLHAVTHKCGALQQNETWLAADGPFVLDCTVMVPRGVTLTIQPLAVVKRAGGVALLVQGTLSADGGVGKMQFISHDEGAV
jgi:hypothetical protein